MLLIVFDKVISVVLEGEMEEELVVKDCMCRNVICLWFIMGTAVPFVQCSLVSQKHPLLKMGS